MARSGPTIPIFIDIDTSAKAAMKKWEKFNLEFQKISAKYERQAQNKGLSAKQYKPAFEQLAAYRLAMKGTAKTADDLRNRIQALTATLNATNPNTKMWARRSEQLNQAKAQLAEIEKKIKGVGTVASSSVGKAAKSFNSLNSSFLAQDGYISRLISRLALYWGIHQAATFLKNIRAVSAEFELQRVALGSILQSVASADVLFERIKKAAVKSPFQVKDLVTFTKQLSAYQIEQDKLFGTMSRLADLSAGLGVDMQRLILAYGQVKSASVLRGQEMRQFTEAGIPLVQALAEKFTELKGTVVSTADVFDLVSKRAVSFEMVKEVIEDMTSAGGQFYKMQEKQAETMAGQWSNLKDSISIMYDEMGHTEGVQDAISSLIEMVRNMTANWQHWVKVAKGAGIALVAIKVASMKAKVAASALTAAEAKAAITTSTHYFNLSRLSKAVIFNTAMLKKNTTWVNAGRKALWADTVATELLVKAKRKAAMATTLLGKAFWSLTAAIAANPIGAFAVAISAVVGWAVTLVQSFKDVEKTIKSAKDSAVELQETVDRFLESEDTGKRLFDTYEKLSKKQNKTLQDEAKLRAITNIIVDRYGQIVVESINEETGARKLNLGVLKDQIKAEQEYFKQQAQEDVRVKREEDLAKAAKKRRDAEEKLQEMQANPERVVTTVGRTLVTTTIGYTTEQIEKQKKVVKEAQDDYEALLQSIADAENKLATSVGKGEDSMKGWRKALLEYSTTIDGVVHHAFEKDEVAKYETISDAMDDAIKNLNSYKAKLENANRALVANKNLMLKQSLEADVTYSKAMVEMWQAIVDALGAVGKTKGGEHQKSAFITQIEAQIDYMKEFSKGVSDLKKYRTELEALQVVQEKMGGRGRAIGIDAATITGAPADLSSWLSKQIDEVERRLRKFAAFGKAGGIVDLLGIQVKDKDARDLQVLLQKLWDEKTNLDLSIKEREFKDALSELSTRVARAKEAREFWESILDITGSEDYANQITSSIFGQNGADLERALNDNLSKAFESMSNNPKVAAAIEGGNWLALRELAKQLPEEARKAAEGMLDANIKADADWILDMEKTYRKAKDFEVRRKEIQDVAERRRQGVRERKISPAKKTELIGAIDKKELEDLAALDLEILKNTSDWEKAFGDINRIGNATISGLIDLIDQLIEKYKVAGQEGENALTPEALKTLTQARERLVKEQEERTPAVTFGVGLAKYSKNVAAAAKYRKELKKLTKGTKDYAAKLAQLKKAEDNSSEGLQQMKAGIGKLNKTFTDLQGVVTAVQDIFTELGMDAKGDLAAGFEGVAKALSIVGAALMFINAAVTLLESHPLIIAGMAIVAALVAIVTVLNSVKTARANREIEAQQKKIEALEEAYESLEKQIEKTFGSDYINVYNQQLTNLQARITAYNAQIAAERTKGKDADEEAIADYEKNIRDITHQIEDMQTQLSEHFAGTDLTSAARDFATAWIEAYKEFSNTTDAMSDKFSEMVQNMITESLTAYAMQGLLRPIFEAIDKAAESGGELTAEEISSIAQLTKESVPAINEAMVNLMNELAAAGLNVRQQATGLTGISRDIATASEESILGLAAGINTQNFYIAQTNDYVFQILNILRGGALAAVPTSAATAASSPADNYLASLPTIADHTAAIVRHCESLVEQCQSIATDVHRVVQPRGSSGSYWIVTN